MKSITTMRRASVAFACALAVAASVGVGGAYALFTGSAHGETVHPVKAFPIELEVEPVDYVAQQTVIDRDHLQVTATYSDGTSRVLEADEYELTPNDIPAGFKGIFEGSASYEEGLFEVETDYELDVNEAYGAQYGTALVFGRGMPADIYDETPLATTTWGIEESGCVPKWNKSEIVTVEDIDSVSPVSVSGWFNNSPSLQTVDLDEIDMSSVTSFYGMFVNDTALKTVNAVGWDTSNVASLAEMFNNCRSLTGVNGIADWNTSNVREMYATFRWCTSLETIDLSRWNTGNVTTVNAMFCMAWQGNALKSVGNIGNWNVSNMRDMACLFQGDTKLAYCGDLSRWNTGNVTNMGCIFQYCQSLTSIGDLSNWNVSRNTNFMNAFQYCNNISSLGDISGWNTGNVTDMFQMFQWDSKLVANCSKWNVSKVTTYTNFNGNGADRVTAPRF